MMPIHFSLCAGVLNWPGGMANVTAVVHTHSVNAIKFARGPNAPRNNEAINWPASRMTKVCFFSYTQLNQTINIQYKYFYLVIRVFMNGLVKEMFKA